MGLIKAMMNATGGTLRDQYKDFIYCEALPMDVLMRKGSRANTQGSTNKGNDNIITNGSKIAVADGQCLLIVENGKVIDFCAEPGEFTYESNTSPSMLTGGKEGLKESFKQLWDRTTTGGGQNDDQRVYFVNTKEIMGNKVGSGDIPFRDSEFNFTIKIRYFGEYSYRITDPLAFYKNVVGNIAGDFRRDIIDSQFKAEIQSSMQPVLGRIALTKVPYDQLPLHTKAISTELNKEITEDWIEKRGISVVSFTIASVTPDADSAKKIEDFQSSRVYTDASMLGAKIGTAQAEAMIKAASNENGAMMGFMGLGMANQAGGMNAAELLKMGHAGGASGGSGVAENQKQGLTAEDTWECSCGVSNTGKFCNECGSPKPEKKVSSQWVCSCGTTNTGKFCSECGKQGVVSCNHCSYTSDKAFKFCPECGGAQ